MNAFPTTMRRWTFLFAIVVSLGLLGCGGAESSPDETARASERIDRTITLHPKGNLLKYEETEFTVAPGQTIKLVFENTATSESMLHNVVVLNESSRKELLWRVGEAGVEAGPENEYVPDDPAILAYTPMADPGETVSVTFTVPDESGEYGYLCTFPGHYVTMYGTMQVKTDAA